MFYEDVRDFILRELRLFKEPYVTGTEVVYPAEESVPRMENLDNEILISLREIRDILRNKKDKPSDLNSVYSFIFSSVESLKLLVPFNEFADSLGTVRKAVLLFNSHFRKRLTASRGFKDGIKPET